MKYPDQVLQPINNDISVMMMMMMKRKWYLIGRSSNSKEKSRRKDRARDLLFLQIWMFLEEFLLVFHSFVFGFVTTQRQ